MARWAEVWRCRSALVYAMGCWTLLGYTIGSIFGLEMPERPQPEPADSKDDLKTTSLYKTSEKQFSFLSTMIYKPNFVPYSVRFQSFWDENFNKGK